MNRVESFSFSILILTVFELLRNVTEDFFLILVSTLHIFLCILCNLHSLYTREIYILKILHMYAQKSTS